MPEYHMLNCTDCTYYLECDLFHAFSLVSICRQALLIALSRLEGSNNAIGCDIEGVNLGKNGEIATVQLCATDSTDVYIIDVAILKVIETLVHIRIESS